MSPGFRKAVGRLLLAALIMTGGVLLVFRAALDVISTQPGTDDAPVPPATDASAYSRAFVQDVLYGAATSWHADRVAATRDLGNELLARLPASDEAARALVSDQVAYMDWLLACHDSMDSAMDTAEAGLFGVGQDQLAAKLDLCDGSAMELMSAVAAHSAAYPRFRFSSVPGYGSWDPAAILVMGMLDRSAAAAVEVWAPYSSFFHGSSRGDFANVEAVTSFLADKTIGPALGSSGSSAVVLASTKVDAASAVGFWLREANALGSTGLRLEIRLSEGEARPCGVTDTAEYCPLGGGTPVQTVHPAQAPYNAKGLSMFWATNPNNDEEFGVVLRNGGSTELDDMAIHVECHDGSMATDLDVPTLPPESQTFTPLAFSEDAECPGKIQLVDGEGNVLLERWGEVAGDLGFAW